MLIQHFRETGVRCEMWIGGSFFSLKEWPGDVDIVLFLERSGIDKANAKQMHLLEQLNDRPLMKAQYLADVYFDPQDLLSRKKYWEETFGRDKETGEPKGIGVLRIGYE
jgi:hypothetical protein